MRAAPVAVGALLSEEGIPARVLATIEQLLASRWTGRVTLNIREGVVLDYEVALKERVEARRDGSRRQNERLSRRGSSREVLESD